MIGIQLIGFAGAAFAIMSFQCKKNRNLFLLQLLCNLCYFVQFMLLGALTGCYSQIVGITRNVFLIRKWEWMRWKIWAILICLMQVLITIFTWKNMLSLLPLIANIALTIGGWTNNPRKVRIANMFFNSPCWLIYDICFFSLAGIVTEVFCQVSTLISIKRYGWEALNEQQ